MSHTTLFRHCNCGGAIVLDLSRGIKLVAPAFSVGADGLNQLVIDISNNEQEIDPMWSCTKCGKEVQTDAAVQELESECKICGEMKPVSELYNHSRLICVCSGCIRQIRNSKETKDPRIAEFMNAFGLKPGSEFTKMTSLLNKKIRI